MILHAFGAPRPRRYQSGEIDYVGSISKVRDQRMRTCSMKQSMSCSPGDHSCLCGQARLNWVRRAKSGSRESRYPSLITVVLRYQQTSEEAADSCEWSGVGWIRDRRYRDKCALGSGLNRAAAARYRNAAVWPSLM